MAASLTDERVLARFKELIRYTCGFSFAMDRRETLVTALKKRMVGRNILTPESYYAVLIQEQVELHTLVELLTVNETYFFREPGHLKLVIDTLVPELLARRQSGPIRILSAGCSTGEEPYSIAMLLQERYGAESGSRFSITGVDIDSNAVAAAQKGLYGKQSFRGGEPELLKRYFEPAGTGLYRICDTIKGQVRFEVVNLLATFYSMGMRLPDIIFYRNVSIYFPQDVQQEIFGRLADLLNEGGALIVGASETLHHDLGILALVQRNALFYYSKLPVLSIEDRRAVQRNPAPTVKTGTARHVPHHIGLPAARESKTVRPAEKPVLAKPVRSSIDLRQQFDFALEKARNNQHDEALDLLETIISHDRLFLQAHGLKASLLLNVARHDDARSTSETMLELDPLCREAYLMLGIIARHRGDDTEAFKRFREALYIDASCWLAHFYTAEIMFTRQEVKRARGSYETVVTLLETGSFKQLGQVFFPLSFNVQQYISICRHKLSLLKEYR